MRRIIIVLLLFPWILSAQEILEVVDQSVIIQKDDGVGKIGDEKWVVRESDRGTLPIGRVKINKSVQDMLIADITVLKPGYQVVIGDRIVDKDPFLVYDARDAIQPGKTNWSSLYNDAGLRRFRFGVSGGAIMLYENIYRHYQHSYQVGALFQLAFSQRSLLLLDLMYSLTDPQTQLEKNLKTSSQQRSIINVNVIYRQCVVGPVFMDLGAGVYIPQLSISASFSQQKINSLEYFYGVCGGVAVGLIESGSFSVYFVPRYHAYLAKTELIENLTGGVNIVF